jgi:hypothetical protein
MTELRVAKIDCNDEELIVDFTDAKQLRIPLVHFPRLRAATPGQRNEWSLIGRGRGVHWETIHLVRCEVDRALRSSMVKPIAEGAR